MTWKGLFDVQTKFQKETTKKSISRHKGYRLLVIAPAHCGSSILKVRFLGHPVVQLNYSYYKTIADSRLLRPTLAPFLPHFSSKFSFFFFLHPPLFYFFLTFCLCKKNKDSNKTWFIPVELSLLFYNFKQVFFLPCIGEDMKEVQYQASDGRHK